MKREKLYCLFLHQLTRHWSTFSTLLLNPCVTSFIKLLGMYVSYNTVPLSKPSISIRHHMLISISLLFQISLTVNLATLKHSATALCNFPCLISSMISSFFSKNMMLHFLFNTIGSMQLQDNLSNRGRCPDIGGPDNGGSTVLFIINIHSSKPKAIEKHLVTLDQTQDLLHISIYGGTTQ